MSLSIVFLLPRRQIKGIDINKPSAEHDTNVTNVTNSRIVLTSYPDTLNGHVTSDDSVEIDMGDNPAYIPPV